jgi:hypothetical protein
MLDFAGLRIGLFATALASVALLSGCGGGEAAVQSSTSPPSKAVPTTAQALSLTGAPVASVKVGENYSFQPVVSGSTAGVGFAIQNKPVWANFNTTTGALTGTPSAAHIGSYSNIVISASSASGASAALAAFSLAVTQIAAAAPSNGSATLSWTPPTQNTDGSAISNLAGYRIYYGNSAGSLTNSINVTNPGLTAYTVANLGSGTTYFGITAYTAGGVESGFSNIGSKTIM